MEVPARDTVGDRGTAIPPRRATKRPQHHTSAHRSGRAHKGQPHLPHPNQDCGPRHDKRKLSCRHQRTEQTIHQTRQVRGRRPQPTEIPDYAKTFNTTCRRCAAGQQRQQHTDSAHGISSHSMSFGVGTRSANYPGPPAHQRRIFPKFQLGKTHSSPTGTTSDFHRPPKVDHNPTQQAKTSDIRGLP